MVGSNECCIEDEERGLPTFCGAVDLEQYGPKPRCGDGLADKVTPWRSGPDCDGQESALERVIGRRRVAHTLPILGWVGIGRHSPPGYHEITRTPALEAEILRRANICFCISNSQTIDGVRIRDDDVVASDGQNFAKLIDGGDIGLSDLEIDALAVVDRSHFLISFSDDFTVDRDHLLPGITGLIRDEDVVLFEARCLGEQTRGVFRLFLDGSEIGLTDDDADIDAIELLADGSLLLSVAGEFRIGKERIKPGDVVKFTPSASGYDKNGTWNIYAKGGESPIEGQDIDALAALPDNALLLSTERPFQFRDTIVRESDVFSLNVEGATQELNGDPHQAQRALLLSGDGFNVTAVSLVR